MDPFSLLLKVIWWILKVLANFITGYSYTYLEAHMITKYILMFLTGIIVVVCFLLIVFNSFKGISHIIKDLFGLDSYKYINYLNIDLENNFSKLYLPEFIISCTGLAALIGILLYIISYEKAINKSEDPVVLEAAKDVGTIGSLGMIGVVGATGAAIGSDVSSIPKIPEVPTIPEVPKISEVPKIPSISSVPSLSSLSSMSSGIMDSLKSIF